MDIKIYLVSGRILLFKDVKQIIKNGEEEVCISYSDLDDFSKDFYNANYNVINNISIHTQNVESIELCD